MRAVSAAGSTTCALRDDGTVWCWGRPLWKPLSYTTSPTPSHVAGLDGASQIAVGTVWTCALSGSAVSCLGGYETQAANTIVAYGSEQPLSVTSGMAMLSPSSDQGIQCAIDANGVLQCWLAPQYRAPPAGPGAPAVGTVETNVSAAASGGTTGCIVDEVGAVYCFDDTNGQSPQPLGSLVATGVSAVAAGDSHACALSSNGSVLCWGDNSLGQLGDGTTLSSVTAVETLPPGSAVGIVAGPFSTCAWSSVGTIACWGHHPLNNASSGATMPSVVLDSDGSPFTGAIGVALGSHHGCALTRNGAIACWGDDDAGQSGAAGAAPVPTPQPVVISCNG